MYDKIHYKLKKKKIVAASKLLVGVKFLQPLWETIWQFLIRVNMQLPYDPAISGSYDSWTFIPEK